MKLFNFRKCFTCCFLSTGMQVLKHGRKGPCLSSCFSVSLDYSITELKSTLGQVLYLAHCCNATGRLFPSCREVKLLEESKTTWHCSLTVSSRNKQQCNDQRPPHYNKSFHPEVFQRTLRQKMAIISNQDDDCQVINMYEFIPSPGRQ